MTMLRYRSFENLRALKNIRRDLLTRFLDGFKDDLEEKGIQLPGYDDGDLEFYAGWTRIHEKKKNVGR